MPYKLDEENRWNPDMDDLRNKITDSTKIIFLINPNNPTGTVLDKKTIQEIINIAGEFGIPVASDEIYDSFVFEGEHTPTASVAKDVPVIGLNGFSKKFFVPGWRIGYTYFHDPLNRLALIKTAVESQCRQRLSANTPCQLACINALENCDHLPSAMEKLRGRAEFAWKRFNSLDGIVSVKPAGAFYIFPRIELRRWQTDKEFVLDLLKNTGVAFSYGSGFDAVYGKGHFRSVILPPINIMEEAFDLLEDFMYKG